MKNKKLKKRLIILGVVAVLIAGGIIGVAQYFNYKNDQKTVEVVPMMYVSNTYWGDQTSSGGNIVSDYMQEIYPDSSKSISEIFVEEGQQVSIGTPLLQYNRESLELDVEAKTIAQKQVQVRIDEANRQLTKLNKTTAYVPPTPTPVPKITPTPRPTASPTPVPTATPVPTPTPIPTPDVNVYGELTGDSVPYKGSGTPEDPYVFMCRDGFKLNPDFMKLMFGLMPSPDPTETPSPSPEPSETPSPEPGPTDGNTPEPSETPAPDDGPRPVKELNSPFAAVFEVRENDSNYGKLLSSLTMDGTGLSGSVSLPGLLSGVSAMTDIVSDAIDNPAAVKAAPTPTPTPKPTPEPDNYNHMMYTKEQLEEEIKKKKQELTELQHEMKQAQLDLDRANRALENSTVLSTVDGQVRTLIDIDSATAEGKPFLVVSGAQQYYVNGTLSETLLGSVNVGDEVSVNSWMNGMTYTAQIVSISDYPAENSNYYSSESNPNSSNYEFTAVILDPDDTIQNGTYVDITMNVNDTSGSDAYYLDKMYIREDDSGYYVMKAGKDNRLVKSYITVGKSIWGGSSLEIKAGIGQDEFIAFPYGPDVKEGVRVIVQDTGEPPYPDGSEDDASSLSPEDGTQSGAAPDGGVDPDMDVSAYIPEDDVSSDDNGGDLDSSESEPIDDYGGDYNYGGGETVVTGSMSDLKLYSEGGDGSD